MNVAELTPLPAKRELFKRSRCRFVPDASGCYVLTTFNGCILYIGLTQALRRRMQEHLDNREKTTETLLGRATFFYWLESTELNKLERTWLNTHVVKEAALPLLNRMYSPVSI